MNYTRPDCVICPACCHQFGAISVDDQAYRAKLEHENALLVEAVQRAAFRSETSTEAEYYGAILRELGKNT